MQNKLLIFSASWCRPCSRLQKNLEGLENIVKYDIDISRETALEWKVDAVPTIILVNYKNQELYRTVGVLSRDRLVSLLNE